MSVGARILKWQLIRAYAGPQYGEPVTAYFYPAAGTGGSSVDGRVSRLGFRLSWMDIHDGAGTNVANVGTTDRIHIRASNLVGTWEAIHRMILTFPTSSIPAGAKIDSAQLRLYCTYKEIEWGTTPTVAVYESNPTSHNVLVIADYQKVMAEPLSSLIPFADIAVNDYVTFPLNDLGLTKIIPAGVTKLALREGTWDAPDNMPPWGIGWDWVIMFRCADYANTTYDPRLEVTYRPLL